MANSGYLSITTAATLLNTDTNEAPGSTGGIVEIVVPAGGVTVYVGGSAVTADTTAGTGGRPVTAGQAWSCPYSPGEGIYGIVATGTQSVNVFRQGV